MSAAVGSCDFFNYYFVLLVMRMLMVSGVFIPFDNLPAFMQTVVQCLSLIHAFELICPLITKGIQYGAVHLSVIVAYALVGYYLAVVMVCQRLRV